MSEKPSRHAPADFTAVAGIRRLASRKASTDPEMWRVDREGTHRMMGRPFARRSQKFRTSGAEDKGARVPGSSTWAVWKVPSGSGGAPGPRSSGTRRARPRASDGLGAGPGGAANDGYPVDPAGSHMLVLRAKPCTSQYERLTQRNCEWLITSAIIHLAVVLDGYPQEFWG